MVDLPKCDALKNSLSSKIKKLLFAIFVIAVTVAIDVIISFCVASAVFFELIALHLTSNRHALLAAILVSIGTIAYIKYNHKLLMLLGDVEKNE